MALAPNENDVDAAGVAVDVFPNEKDVLLPPAAAGLPVDD